VRAPGRLYLPASTLAAAASFEVGSVLLPALLVFVLESTPAALGVIEGVAIGLAAAARFAGGAVMHDMGRRRRANVAGYGALALCTSAMAAAAATGQAAVLRAGAWVAGGFRTVATPLDVYEGTRGVALGRAFGFDRAMEHAGAGAGAALAVILVATLDIRAAIALAVVPGVAAVVLALRAKRPPEWAPPPDVPSLRAAIRELGHGRLGWTLAAIGALEAANITLTLLILRATALFEHERSVNSAVVLAIFLFLGYRLAGAVAAVASGRGIDRQGPAPWLGGAAITLLAAYAVFAQSSGGVASIAIAFVLAGAAVGVVETGEAVAVARAAPEHARALAFGAVGALQSAGRVFASIAAGVVWTVISPSAGLLITGPLLLACPLLLLVAVHRRS
jgi:MFS family permease